MDSRRGALRHEVRNPSAFAYRSVQNWKKTGEVPDAAAVVESKDPLTRGLDDSATHRLDNEIDQQILHTERQKRYRLACHQQRHPQEHPGGGHQGPSIRDLQLPAYLSDWEETLDGRTLEMLTEMGPREAGC